MGIDVIHTYRCLSVHLQICFSFPPLGGSILSAVLVLVLVGVDTSENCYSSVIRGRIGLKFGRRNLGMNTQNLSGRIFDFPPGG